MNGPGRALAFVCAAAFACSCLLPLSSGVDEDDDYTLYVRPDETKISIVSGNLTIAVTRDWPRMVFHHSKDPFSPTFDIGFPKLYLFNDSDGDGRFCRSEASHMVYLDSNHARWNVSAVEVAFSQELGEFVTFSMTARVDAYNGTLATAPSIESWADVTFWFRLTENGYDHLNPAGRHPVSGRTEMLVNMTLDVTNRTGFGFVALERLLQGGATTNMFHVLEDGPGGVVSATLSARVNEDIIGQDFTRPLNSTQSPVQAVEFAKQDGTVQAFYRWGSAVVDSRCGPSLVPVNSSCLTTGTGMLLHSSLPLTNGTLAVSLDSSLGIEETGFVGSVTDWVKELGLAIVIAAVAVAAVAVAGLHVVLRRRRLRRERPEGDGPGEAS